MEKITCKFNAFILVVDDYIINQEMTKEILEIMNCTVDVAVNGKEAIIAYQQNAYDIIFMDIQMPELDGLKATEEIRKLEEEDKHTPIIALTANALPGDKERYLAAGIDDYICKPIKIKDLEIMLKKYLKPI
ncbi:response regulator [Candidatus Protochlamydia phocaeensis]|uniref:response regulator n=1 Tax=Candidatus Protochlamydia phocaeensis TaxID=1414722 RepID=UPI000839A964|nr:response regulator [Candidatus Protochlamydia phocaeensis]